MKMNELEKVVNAIKNSSKQNARVEFESALMDIIISIMKDNMELFKQYNSNDLFKKWLSDKVFDIVYNDNIRKSDDLKDIIAAEYGSEYK